MHEIKSDPLGLEIYQQVFGEPNQDDPTGVREFTINHLFAHIWNRPDLSVRDRRLITIALLVAQGRSDQLKQHLRGAFKAGFSNREMLEIMIHVAHYAGWASGTSGQEMALDVFNEIEAETDPNKQSLRQVTEEMGARERDADGTFFQGLLADDFVFRRANGDIVHKAEYLQSLERVAENPYERLETHVREVAIDKDSAVVTVLVVAKRKQMEHLGRFNNVRMFRREDDKWKLVAWINTRQV